MSFTENLIEQAITSDMVIFAYKNRHPKLKRKIDTWAKHAQLEALGLGYSGYTEVQYIAEYIAQRIEI